MSQNISREQKFGAREETLFKDDQFRKYLDKHLNETRKIFHEIKTKFYHIK